jgi:hypothetical protein
MTGCSGFSLFLGILMFFFMFFFISLVHGVSYRFHALDIPILPSIIGSQIWMDNQELIQVDIGGHPPFPTGSKLFSGNFGNLLFLAGFNFRGHFEGLNEGFSR